MRLYKRNGSPHWWAQWYDPKGKRHRQSTRTDDKTLAQALVAKWQQSDFLEHHFGAIPEVPFRDALLRYAEDKKRENPSGYEASLRYQLQRLLDRFGGLMLAEIEATLIRDYVNERRRTIKVATIHRELSVLQAILNRAKRDGLLAEVPAFPKLKLPKGRCRWLTPEEETRLLQASSPHLRKLIAFAIDTGGRRSEVLRLDWRYVDLAYGRITFIETKNGENRSLRLTERAQGILESLGPKDRGPVFTYHGKALASVTTSFQRARTKAGLEDVRFHDLRHTFASRLVQQGVPLYEVMQLTGHKSLIMVQRYAHLAPDFQERAIGALNRFREQNSWHDLGTEGEITLPENHRPDTRNP